MRLIIGGDSFLGKNLSSFWNQKNILHHATTRNKLLVQDNRPFLDLANLENLDFKTTYTSAVMFAGYTRLQACEDDPLITRKINVEASYNILKYLSSIGVFVLCLSSYQVFFGNKPFAETTDTKSPVNEYGKQKAELEDLVSNLDAAAILRFTKVINEEDDLLTSWLNKLENNQPIKAFTDMSVSPVTLDEAISKIDSLLENRVKGIHHCSGKEDISYFKFAQNFALEKGFSSELVKEDLVRSKGLNFHVPIYTTLSIEN